MELKEFFKLILQKKKTLFSIAMIFLLLFFALSFVRPLEYRATTKLLIMQNAVTDAYTAAKSSQFLGSSLAEVVRSDSFLEQVLASGYNIDSTIFSANSEKRKKQWENMISVHASSETGTLIVNNYHSDRYQADQFSQAIAYTLVTKHSLYHGLGNKVSVKIIDNASTSDWPVRPNVLFNSLLGLALGLLAGLFFIYLYPQKEFKIKFKKFSHTSTEDKNIEKDPNLIKNFNYSERNHQAPSHSQAQENDYRGDMRNLGL